MTRDVAVDEPLDARCGTLVARRRSSLATLYSFEFDLARGRDRVGDNVFEHDCAVVTTSGRWLFRGRTSAAVVDRSTVVLGLAGDRYSCAHEANGGESGYVICLAPHALDDGAPLFVKRIVPAGQAVRTADRALRTTSDDAFESSIFRLFDEASARSTSRPPGRPRFRGLRAKRLIERHAFERVRIGDLASEIGVSPFTFFRQFKDDVGTTPLAYISELRLERAKQLLRSSTLPIEEIGQRVGFDDAAYFSRFFRRYAGRPPSSYRLWMTDAPFAKLPPAADG